jgi:predicted porin
MISLQAGIADTFGPQINGRAFDFEGNERESYKTYMGSVSLTAPKEWGAFAGSTLYACVINGFNPAIDLEDNDGADQTSTYIGATVNTPIKELKVGASYDYVSIAKQPLTSGDGIAAFGTSGYANATGLYATYQATEKLSLNSRVEYASDSEGGPLPSNKLIEGTFTAQYDLWKNVLSRVEARWDHACGIPGQPFGGEFGDFGNNDGPRRNAYELIGNVVYKF